MGLDLSAWTKKEAWVERTEDKKENEHYNDL